MRSRRPRGRVRRRRASRATAVRTRSPCPRRRCSSSRRSSRPVLRRRARRRRRRSRWRSARTRAARRTWARRRCTKCCCTHAAGGPRERRRGEHDAGVRHRLVPDVLDQERHERVGPEERERQHAPGQQRRRGGPARARNVPAGTSRMNGRTPTSAPTRISTGMSHGMSLAVNPPITSPAPTATSTRVARARVLGHVGQVGRIRLGLRCGPDPEQRGQGHRGSQAHEAGPNPRKTQRHPRPFADHAGERGSGQRGHDPRGREHREHAGPDRSRVAPPDHRVRDRGHDAGAEALHDAARGTSSGIDGARPAATSPVANSTHPATNGGPGPRRSASRPATTVADEAGEEVRTEDPPVERRGRRGPVRRPGRTVATASAPRSRPA